MPKPSEPSSELTNPLPGIVRWEGFRAILDSYQGPTLGVLLEDLPVLDSGQLAGSSVPVNSPSTGKFTMAGLSALATLRITLEDPYELSLWEYPLGDQFQDVQNMAEVSQDNLECTFRGYRRGMIANGLPSTLKDGELTVRLPSVLITTNPGPGSFQGVVVSHLKTKIPLIYWNLHIAINPSHVLYIEDSNS